MGACVAQVSCGACDQNLLLKKPPEKIVVLRSGARMPRVGFGTAGLGRDTKKAVLMALGAGYRHIDSAQSRLWYREVSCGLPKSESWFLWCRI